MIKTVIKMPVGLSYAVVDPMINDIIKWMNNSFGPEIMRRPNNTRKRKTWSISWDYLDKTITIMCRYPEQAVLVRLRWL